MIFPIYIAIAKGAEFEVLKQIPWEKVEVEVLMVELEHAGKVTNKKLTLMIILINAGRVMINQ